MYTKTHLRTCKHLGNFLDVADSCLLHELLFVESSSLLTIACAKKTQKILDYLCQAQTSAYIHERGAFILLWCIAQDQVSVFLSLCVQSVCKGARDFSLSDSFLVVRACK